MVSEKFVKGRLIKEDKFSAKIMRFSSSERGFDTTSFKSNLDLIAFIKNYLNIYKIKSTLAYGDLKYISGPKTC